jgi:gliding motility-associated-like protein
MVWYSTSLRVIRLLLLIALLAPGESRAQSCCDTTSVITVCYLSAQEYCVSNVGNCTGYSLDGNTMTGGLVPKLLSPLNFGSNGTVDCQIQLRRLDDVSSIQAINDQECAIVFLPNSFVTPVLQNMNLDTTFIPTQVLATVKAWSMECPQNLVIATQGEATFWGYKVQNANVNPNTPAPGPVPMNIFNGPFGSLNQFLQGGSYQGVFTITPATGMIPLAVDAQGNITVCLDLATNDIMLGDIGIFCSGGAGPVSQGPALNNNNDRLACNIFALACAIASLPPPTQQRFEICPLDVVNLPDGSTVNTPGIYLDTLRTFLDCDSVIITEVVWREIPPTLIAYEGCEADGHSVQVGPFAYDEANPIGEVLFETDQGCDSLVRVDLRFLPRSRAEAGLQLCAGTSYILSDGRVVDVAGTYQDTLQAANGCDSLLTLQVFFLEPVLGSDSLSYCQGDAHLLSNGQAIGVSGLYTDTLVAANGCDSLLTLRLTFLADTTLLEQTICPGESVVEGGIQYQAGQTLQRVLTNSAGCDSTLWISLVPGQEPVVVIPDRVTVGPGDRSPWGISVPPGSGIRWEPDTGLSCSNCPDPLVDPLEGLSAYTIQVTDPYGCVWPYEVILDYDCPLYIPSAFSPNNDGINDRFGVLGPDCRLEHFALRIYDRWGGLLFTGTDIHSTWDGTSKGKPLDSGVYIYTMEIRAHGKDMRYKGEFILIK